MASRAVLELLIQMKDEASAGLSSIGDTLTSTAGTLGTIGAVAGGAVVAGFAAAGAAAFNFSSEAQQGVNELQAQLGLSSDEAERLGDVAVDIFANNWGDSLSDVNQGLITVRQQMKGLGEEDLEGATAAAFALRDTFGVDLPESTNAANVLMEKFGLSSQQAFDFIARGFQKGLNNSGDFLDTLTEYGVQFADAGFEADQFFSTLQSGQQGFSSLGTDKIADLVKEGRIRIMEMSEDVVNAFAMIGDSQAKALEFGGSTRGVEALELLRQKAAELGIEVDENLSSSVQQGAVNFSEAYSSLVLGAVEAGTISIADAQQIAISGLKDMENQVWQNTAGVAIFGTQWEDLGPTAALALDTTVTSLEDIAGATDSLNAKYNNWPSLWEGIKRSALVALQPIGDGLLSIASDALPTVQSAVTSAVDVVNSLVNVGKLLFTGDFSGGIFGLQEDDPIIDLLFRIRETVLSLIEAVQTGDFGPFLDSLRSLGETIGPLFGDLIGKLGPIFQELAASAAQWILDALPGLGANLGELYNTLVNWVVDSLPGWIEQLQQLANAAIQWITDSLPGLGTNLGKFAGQLLGWIVQTAIDVAPKLAALGLKFITWVATEVLPKLPGALLAIATGIYNFIAEVVKAVAPKLAELASKFINWVQTDVLPKLPGALANIKSAISKWIGETITWAAGEMTKIGKNMIDGFRSGISDAWSGIESWLHDLAMSLPEWFREWWGIKSPSKVMAGIGGFVLGGLVMGMEGMIPALLSTIDQVGITMINGLKKKTEKEIAEVEKITADLIKQAKSIGGQINDAIASGFQGEASIDRLLADNLDAITKFTGKLGMDVRNQLDDALRVASQFADPKQASEFYKLRSDQILELADLQDQLNQDLSKEDRARIEQQMALIKAAQEAEQKAFGAENAGKQGPIAELTAQLQALLGNTNLPGVFDSPVIASLTAMLQQLQNASAAFNLPTGGLATAGPVNNRPDAPVTYNVTVQVPPGTTSQQATALARQLGQLATSRRSG